MKRVGRFTVYDVEEYKKEEIVKPSSGPKKVPSLDEYKKKYKKNEDKKRLSPKTQSLLNMLPIQTDTSSLYYPNYRKIGRFSVEDDYFTQMNKKASPKASSPSYYSPKSSSPPKSLPSLQHSESDPIPYKEAHQSIGRFQVDLVDYSDLFPVNEKNAKKQMGKKKKSKGKKKSVRKGKKSVKSVKVKKNKK